jgi:hypothetical protein
MSPGLVAGHAYRDTSTCHPLKFLTTRPFSKTKMETQDLSAFPELYASRCTSFCSGSTVVPPSSIQAYTTTHQARAKPDNPGSFASCDILDSTPAYTCRTGHRTLLQQRSQNKMWPVMAHHLSAEQLNVNSLFTIADRSSSVASCSHM